MSEKTEQPVPEIVAQRWLGQGIPDGAIIDCVKEICEIPREQAGAALARVRDVLRGVVRETQIEHQGRSRQTYMMIKRHPDANISQKLRAQQQLDELLGMPERFAEMHAGGPDDPEVIEALAFYRTVLFDKKSNIAQRLRAQNALDRLRRLVPKNTAADLAVTVEDESGARPEEPAAPEKASLNGEKTCNSEPEKETLTPEVQVSAETPPGPPLPHRAAPRTPRNAPCSCGSGKKYKLCCRQAALPAALRA